MGISDCSLGDVYQVDLPWLLLHSIVLLHGSKLERDRYPRLPSGASPEFHPMMHQQSVP